MSDRPEPLAHILGRARVRAWSCLVPEHAERDGVTVEWRDGIASCTRPGCDLTSEHTQRFAADVREHLASTAPSSGLTGEDRKRIKDEAWGAGDDANAYDLDWLIDEVQRLQGSTAPPAPDFDRAWATAFLAEWARPYFADDQADAIAAVMRAATEANLTRSGADS